MVIQEPIGVELESAFVEKGIRKDLVFSLNHVHVDYCLYLVFNDSFVEFMTAIVQSHFNALSNNGILIILRILLLGIVLNTHETLLISYA